jgi:hypothetical protein
MRIPYLLLQIALVAESRRIRVLNFVNYRPLRLFVLSMALAFPLSGITWSLAALAKDPYFALHNPVGALIVFLVQSVWFGIMTPTYVGFPISDEGGVNHLNMYPYIIPTGLIIFFFLSKGWRWFRRTK